MGVAKPIGSDAQRLPDTNNTLIYLKTLSVFRNRDCGKRIFWTVSLLVLHVCPPVCDADTVTATVNLVGKSAMHAHCVQHRTARTRALARVDLQLPMRLDSVHRCASRGRRLAGYNDCALRVTSHPATKQSACTHS